MGKDRAGGQAPPAPRPPSVAQQQLDAAREQAGELRRVGDLIERADQRAAERAAEADKPDPLYGPNFRPEMTVVDADDDDAQRWLWLLRVPGFIDQFQRVPADYWTADTQEMGEVEVLIAVVRCPCGEEPLVEHGRSRECGCERLYLYFGDRPAPGCASRARLLVTNSPKRRPAPRWERIADAAIPERASGRTHS